MEKKVFSCRKGVCCAGELGQPQLRAMGVKAQTPRGQERGSLGKLPSWYLWRDDVKEVPARRILLSEDIAILSLKDHVEDLDDEGAGGERVGDAELPQEVLQLRLALVHKLQRHFGAYRGKGSGEGSATQGSSQTSEEFGVGHNAPTRAPKFMVPGSGPTHPSSEVPAGAALPTNPALRGACHGLAHTHWTSGEAWAGDTGL